MTTINGPIYKELVAANGKNNVMDVVEDVLAKERAESCENDLRRDQRFPYTQLIELTYLDPETDTTVGRTITVACRNLSNGGLGFFHNSPLPLRNVLVQLQPGTDTPRIATKLAWCRCSTADWYEHGGMFLYIDNCTDG